MRQNSAMFLWTAKKFETQMRYEFYWARNQGLEEKIVNSFDDVLS